VQVNLNTAVLLNNLPGFAQNAEVSQTEEVHFKQPDAGDVFHGELSHDHRFIIALARSLQGDKLGERLFGDDDAGSMGAGMA